MIYQESRFNPDAKSWAGAQGLMQLMPAAAEKFGLENPMNPEENIIAGVKYLGYLIEKFNEQDVLMEDRIKFAIASYNVGLGHILDARRLADKYDADPKVWSNNVDTFILLKSNPKFYHDPEVKYGYCRGKETYKYVDKIFNYYKNYKNVIQ